MENVPNKSLFHYINAVEIDEDLKCPICFDPFLEPLTMKCCEYTLCKSCTADCLVCPLCRGDPKPFSNPPRLLLKMLSRIDVSCCACSAVFKRDFFQTHFLEVCPIDCPNGCGETLRGTEGIGKHNNLCTHQIVPCGASVVGCNFSGKSYHVKEHQTSSIYAQKDLLVMQNNLMNRISVLEQKFQNQEIELQQVQQKLQTYDQLLLPTQCKPTTTSQFQTTAVTAPSFNSNFAFGGTNLTFDKNSNGGACRF